MAEQTDIADVCELSLVFPDGELWALVVIKAPDGRELGAALDARECSVLAVALAGVSEELRYRKSKQVDSARPPGASSDPGGAS